MTDKHAFKKMCMENGVDVIPEYTEEEALSGQAEFPLFVKPVDSRGSRGQSVCYTVEELENAISFAKKESSNGDILIEKYMKGAHEFQVTYFFVDGEAYLIRTVDSYCGSEANHLEKVVACAVSPSRFTDEYLKIAHQNVVKMFKAIGYKNGPIFMQGFEDNGKFRFFDPGLRFPGVDYERVYTKEFGIDLMEARKVVERYRKRLSGVEGIQLSAIQENVESNYAYFPVVFDGYKYTRNEVFAMLEEQGITARKYFYPLTNSFECYRNYPTAGTEKTPVAQHLALRVLTLPLYADLALEDVDRICDIILG